MRDPAALLPTIETAVAIVRGPGEGPAVGVLGARSIFKVAATETDGAYAVLEQEVPAGHGPPLHVHRHETEVFTVLEGEFELIVGEERIPAPKGTTAACPRDIPHTFRNVGPATGRLQVTVIPGRFAEYFFEMDREPVHDLATMSRVGAKYGLEILA